MSRIVREWLKAEIHPYVRTCDLSGVAEVTIVARPTRLLAGVWLAPSVAIQMDTQSCTRDLGS